MQTQFVAETSEERNHETISLASAHRPSPGLIREQLDQILGSPKFVSSPRCQHLFRYLIEAALAGNIDHLKERNLGIEVFKRDPDYDTNADPVVRVAVSEIRKKLAQFYYEPANRDGVRIELHPGSYVPVFSISDTLPHGSGPAPLLGESGSVLVAPPAVRPPAPARSLPQLPRRIFKIAALVVLCLLGSGAVMVWHARAAVDPEGLFWNPAIKSPSPILLCLGQLIATSFQLDADTSRNPDGSSMPIEVNASASQGMPVAVMDDSITLANVAGLLRSRNKSFLIRSEARTGYEDLEKGPVVLVGALNNDWTMHMMRSMRFQFHSDSRTMQWWVSDQEKPGVQLGLINVKNGGVITKDLAVVARVIDPETKQPTIILAGLTPPGTMAAGQFVSDPERLAEYMRTASPDWLSKNVEILLSVDVVDAQPGPSHVLATYIW